MHSVTKEHTKTIASICDVISTLCGVLDSVCALEVSKNREIDIRAAECTCASEWYKLSYSPNLSTFGGSKFTTKVVNEYVITLYLSIRHCSAISAVYGKSQTRIVIELESFSQMHLCKDQEVSAFTVTITTAKKL